MQTTQLKELKHGVDDAMLEHLDIVPPLLESGDLDKITVPVEFFSDDFGFMEELTVLSMAFSMRRKDAVASAI